MSYKNELSFSTGQSPACFDVYFVPSKQVGDQNWENWGYEPVWSNSGGNNHDTEADQIVMKQMSFFNVLWPTLPYNEYEWKKNEQVPIQLLSIARTLFNAKKIIKKKFFPWTSEIIQFIWFENHMDRPRYLKTFLGYDIKYHSMVVVTTESQYIGYWIDRPPT